MKEAGFIKYEKKLETFIINKTIQEIWNLGDQDVFSKDDFFLILDKNVWSGDIDLIKTLITNDYINEKQEGELSGIYTYSNIYNHIEKIFIHVVISSIKGSSNMLLDSIFFIYPTLSATNIYNTSFITNLSHEIRTPLNGILGMINILDETQLNAEQKECTEMIIQCSVSLLSVINDILDYSKLEINKIKLDLKPFNLKVCIDEINDNIITKINDLKLSFSLEFDTKININLVGDRNRLWQILINLLYNSIKFTENGKILLKISSIPESIFHSLLYFHENKQISMTESSYNIQYLKFDIIDTGCGILPDDKDKIFNPFTQFQSTNNSLSNISTGTGLGLSICKKLVELMNGSIWLEKSSIQEGSHFIFIIKTDINVEYKHTLEDFIAESNLLSNKNILIIDENKQSRINLSIMSKNMNLQVTTYSNIDEALKNLRYERNIKFDICLINISQESFSFIEALNKDTSLLNHNLPIIGIIDSDKPVNLKDYKTLFKFVITKPISDFKLHEMYIHILKNSPLINQHKSIPYQYQPPPQSQNNNSFTNIPMVTQKTTRILIAEDVQTNRRILVSLLKRMGYTCTETEDGEKCLRELTLHEYDILLLDIKMPKYTGDEIVQILVDFYKKNKKGSYNFINKKLPYLVAVSAYCSVEDIDAYKKIGFDYIISKPLDKEQLRKTLDILTK
jgi:signal transduction histidine kinase/DNA-binding response OmpR family regulator